MSAGTLCLGKMFPNYTASLPNTLFNSPTCGIYSCSNNTGASQEAESEHTSDLQVTL